MESSAFDEWLESSQAHHCRINCKLQGGLKRKQIPKNIAQGIARAEVVQEQLLNFHVKLAAGSLSYTTKYPLVPDFTRTSFQKEILELPSCLVHANK